MVHPIKTLTEQAWDDEDRDTHRITEVTQAVPEYWDVCWGNTCTNLKVADAPPGVGPKVGDLLTHWPAGRWWQIRGKALNGDVFFYRKETPEERDAKDRLHRKLLQGV